MNIKKIFEFLSLGDDYFESFEPSLKTEDNELTSSSPTAKIFHDEQEHFEKEDFISKKQYK